MPDQQNRTQVEHVDLYLGRYLSRLRFERKGEQNQVMSTIHSSDYSRRAFLALAGAGVVSLGGCAATHIHVRDSEANESLRSEDIATVLNAGRSTIPSIPIGISTHFGIIGDAEQRHEIVAEAAHAIAKISGNS